MHARVINFPLSERAVPEDEGIPFILGKADYDALLRVLWDNATHLFWLTQRDWSSQRLKGKAQQRSLELGDRWEGLTGLQRPSLVGFGL